MNLAAAAMNTLQTFVNEIIDRAGNVKHLDELGYLRESFSSFTSNIHTTLAKATDVLDSAKVLREDSEPISLFQQAGPSGHGHPENLTIDSSTIDSLEGKPRRAAVTSFNRAAWTDEEVSRLVQCREGNGNEQIPFEDFVHEFAGRSATSLRQRYYKVRPKQQSGHWKKQKTTPPNVSQQKDNEAVADEAPSFAAPARWTDDEDKKLMQLREGNGDKQVLFETFLHEFPGRSLRAIQRRHDLLRPTVPSEPQKIDIDAIDDDALLSDDEQDLETLPLLPEEEALHVLCPNSDRGCARWFATFADANCHATRFCNQRDKEGPFPCPWANALDCKQMFTTRMGIVSHFAVHNEQPTDNSFPCRRGCGTHWPNAYMLTSHEIRCGLQKTPNDTKLMRINFPSNSDKNERPSVIMIARTSGNYVPKSWSGGFSTLAEGLQSWGAAHLANYRRLFSDERSAVLHVGVNVKTAYLPTSISVNAHLTPDMDASTKSGWRRAHKFTDHIAEDLQAAPNRPTIINIGSDGFSCNTGLLQPFLERVVSLDMVIRHNFISYRNGNGPSLDPTLLSVDGLCWWKAYRSEDILQRLKGSLPSRGLREIDELIAWWDEQQHRKDLRREYSLVPGRNL